MRGASKEQGGVSESVAFQKSRKESVAKGEETISSGLRRRLRVSAGFTSIEVTGDSLG